MTENVNLEEINKELQSLQQQNKLGTLNCTLEDGKIMCKSQHREDLDFNFALIEPTKKRIRLFEIDAERLEGKQVGQLDIRACVEEWKKKK